MSDLLVGLLSAALATNPPAAVSNLIVDRTGFSVPIVANTNDPVEREYQKLILLDDESMRQIEKWLDQGDAGNGDATGAPSLTINQRIEQKEKGVKAAYDDFLMHHPNHARAHIAYGSFLNETRNEEGAIAEWEKGRELDPKNPAAWNNCANYYGHRGPVTNAFAYYAKAIELGPNEPVYYHNLAVTVYLFRVDAEQFFHIDEKQVFDKALALYREAIKRDPNNFVLASDYAESFYGTKPPRWEEGLVAWSNALNIARDDVEREGVYIHLARINLRLNHFADAHRWLDKVTNNGYAGLKQRIAKNLRETEYPTNTVPFN